MRMLLPLCVAIAVSGADPFDFADLRLSGVVMTASSDIGSGNSVTEWDEGHRYALDVVVGNDLLFVGLAYGLGVAMNDRSAPGLDYESTTAHAQAGPYLSLGPVQIELLALAGAGTADLNTSSGKDTSAVSEYGANLNFVLGLGRMAVGLTGGWLQSKSTHKLNGVSDIELSGGDVSAGALIGWRF